jgi:hypothetical protein
MSFCNRKRRPPRDQAGSARASRVARPMLKRTVMKDLIFVGISVAFFAVGWLYAQSFDRL